MATVESTGPSRRFEILDLVRLIAVLIVFNRHAERLYPDWFQVFSTGGSVANSLFFIVSGYLTDFDRVESFPKYFAHRVGKLYLVSTICTVVIYLIEGIAEELITDFVALFIFPTRYWFLGAIVLFLILLYLAEKLGYRQHFALFTGIMILIYIVGYFTMVDLSQWSMEEIGLSTTGGYFKLIHYFYIYALGYALRKTPGMAPEGDSKRGKKLIASAVGLFLLQLVLKFIMSKKPELFAFQFVSQVLDVFIAYFVLSGCLLLNSSYCESWPEPLRKAVSRLSSYSFEMFTVQLEIMAICAPLPFPLNALAALICSFAVSAVLHTLVDRLLSKKKAEAH